MSDETILDGPGALTRRAADSPKSLRTRRRILQTAERLFVEIGYHEATNARIAEAAQLTRGAMLYHFPTRESLVEAAVDYIQSERARLFEQAAEDAPHGADRTDHAIESYWRLLSSVSFVAFAELESAARVDPLLRERLRPAQEAFDRAQVSDHMFDLVQAGEGPRFQASRDVARFLLEGLARAHLAYDAEARTDRMLSVAKRVARNLNRKGVRDLWED